MRFSLRDVSILWETINVSGSLFKGLLSHFLRQMNVESGGFHKDPLGAERKIRKEDEFEGKLKMLIRLAISQLVGWCHVKKSRNPVGGPPLSVTTAHVTGSHSAIYIDKIFNLFRGG